MMQYSVQWYLQWLEEGQLQILPIQHAFFNLNNMKCPPHLLIQPPYIFREAFALQLHVLHINLPPASRPPCGHAGFHHADHVPQLLQQAHLTPQMWKRVMVELCQSTASSIAAL